MPYYFVYTPTLRRSTSDRWTHPKGVSVIYGPLKELQLFKSRNSLRSKQLAHVKEEYFGQGDSRYRGPRSHFGQLLEAAHAWAKGKKLKPLRIEY